VRVAVALALAVLPGLGGDGEEALARRPEELSHAAPGRWEGFFTSG